MPASSHPVDSTYYPCCRGIGGHSRHCPDGPAAVFAAAAIEPAPAGDVSTTPDLSEVDATLPGMNDDAELVDVGPATPPPRWCPEAEPDWQTRSGRDGGGQFCTWTRTVDGELWISCYDEIICGRVMRSQPRIYGTEEPREGWTAEEARELARELIAAADLIDGAG